MDAAIELLIERGWAATTAVAVCERAGVTRGALVHHYPSLSALLAHALDSLYAQFTNDGETTPTSLVSMIDAIWAAVGDRRFKAVLEAWSAAGNDRELALELGPTIARFAKLVSPSSGPPEARALDAEETAFVLTAREAMLGLALGRATNGGKPLPHESMVLARLRAEATQLDDQIDTQTRRRPDRKRRS